MYGSPDDDDLFAPAQGSNLASLFGTSMTFPDSSNTSLTYTAPKQPKVATENAKVALKLKPQSSIYCVVRVDLYKLVDKTHVPEGKHGLAIIGNESLKVYEIIIYVDRQNILTRTKITPSFNFIEQQNHFASFSDENKQNWLVHFENDEDVNKFSRAIQQYGGKIVKCNQETIKTVMFDAKVVESDTKIAISDIKPTVSDSKPELHVKPTNLQLASRHSEADASSQSDSSEKQTKANILNRMAKMGQPILPVPLPRKSTDLSESETDECNVNKKPVRKIKRNNINKEINSQKTFEQNTNKETMDIPSNDKNISPNKQTFVANSLQQTINQGAITPSGGQFPNQLFCSYPNQMLYNPLTVTPISDPFNLLVAENRTHNCEIRMSLLQLSSKVDQVLDKINKSDTASISSDENVSKMKIYILEQKVSELTAEIENRDKIIKGLNENISSLQSQHNTNDNQRINELQQQEENEMLKNTVSQLECRISDIQKQKNEIQDQLEHFENLQQNNEEKQKQNEILKQTVQDQTEKITELETIINTNKNNDNKLNVDDLKIKIVNFESQLQRLREYHDFNETLKLKQSENEKLKATQFSDKLKKSMNLMYKEILSNFDDDNATFHSTDIKNILAQNIKMATFRTIEQFNNDFLNIASGSDDRSNKESSNEQQQKLLAPEVPEFNEEN